MPNNVDFSQYLVDTAFFIKRARGSIVLSYVFNFKSVFFSIITDICSSNLLLNQFQ